MAAEAERPPPWDRPWALRFGRARRLFRELGAERRAEPEAGRALGEALAHAVREPAERAVALWTERDERLGAAAGALLARMGLSAAESLLALRAPLAPEDERARLRALAATEAASRSRVLAWLRDALDDRTSLPAPPEQAGTIEVPVLPRRVCDEAFVAMKRLIDVAQPPEERIAEVDELRQMPEAERDRVLGEAPRSARWEAALGETPAPEAPAEPVGHAPPFEERLEAAAGSPRALEALARELDAEAAPPLDEATERLRRARERARAPWRSALEALAELAIPPLLRAPLPEGAPARVWRLATAVAETGELRRRVALHVDARLDDDTPLGEDEGADAGGAPRMRDEAFLALRRLVGPVDAGAERERLLAQPPAERDRTIAEARGGTAWRSLTGRG